MEGYRKLTNAQGEPDRTTHQRPNTRESTADQDNQVLYDPRPVETRDGEENWDAYPGDEISFSPASANNGSIGKYCCCGQTGSHRHRCRFSYLTVSISALIALCILAAIIAGVILGSTSARSSPASSTVWFETAVGYQIFPRSFQDSNGDGMGDLQGIINRLDYLKYLDIDAIWLSALNPSPFTDIGLDVTNFTAIDPLLGDMQEFKTLVKSAHDKGMKIVMDFVPNQSSKDHFWFQQSRTSQTNNYSDYYIWADGIREGQPPNDWTDASGNPSWKYEPARGQWFHYSFLETEPSLNFDSPRVMKEIEDSLRFWLEQDIDGIYMRHVNHILGIEEIIADQNELGARKSRATSDNGSFGSLQRIKSLIKQWRQVLADFQSSDEDVKLLVVESMDMDIFNTNLQLITTSMYGTKDEPLADYPFNYALFDIHKYPTNGHTIKYIVQSWLTQVRPKDAPTNWVLGSPQISRISTRYEPRFVPAVTMLMMALPGSPLLYYGDEIGMVDAYNDETKESIPYSPMQWNDDSNAGFTQDGVQPWTGIANGSSLHNIKMHQDNPTSLLNFIRGAIRLRHLDPELVSPRDTIHLYSLHSVKELLVFLRTHREVSYQNFLFAANFADYDVTEDLTLIVTSTQLPDKGKVAMATDVTQIQQTIDLRNVTLCSGDYIAVEFYNDPS